MNKLLLLALLGLGLGGGLWMSQNPDGTLEDLTGQTADAASRLKAGVDAGFSAVREQRFVLDQRDRADARVDARLEIIEQAVKQSGLEGRELVETVERTLAASSEQMQSLEQLTTELSARFEDAEQNREADIARLESIDQRLAALGSRLDQQSIDDDMASLVTAIDDLRGDVSSLTEDFRQHQSRIDLELVSLEETTDTLGLRLSSLADPSRAAPVDSLPEEDERTPPPIRLSISAGVDERLAALETKLANVNRDSRRIESLTRRLNTANEKIRQLEANKAESSQSLSELSASLEQLQSAGEAVSIDAVQDEIRQQLAQIENRFEQDSNDAELEDEINATRVRLQSLEERVQSLPASSTEADQALQIQDELQTRIAGLEQSLAAVGNTDEGLASMADTVENVADTIEDVKARVDRLSARQTVESVEYKIYFDRNSADITGDASAVLNSFIAQEKNRTTGVSIYGFTDRSGPANYNQQLALQRATNVRSYLIQNGLDYTKIKVLSGLGEDIAASIVPDNSDDAQQRVVVLFADQP